MLRGTDQTTFLAQIMRRFDLALRHIRKSQRKLPIRRLRWGEDFASQLLTDRASNLDETLRGNRPTLKLAAHRRQGTA